MLIRVRYLNGKYDLIRPPLLDRLIDEMRVLQFRRSRGWVHVHRDPVRRGIGRGYSGEERRSSHLEGGPAPMNRGGRSDEDVSGGEAGGRTGGFILLMLVFFLLSIVPMAILLIRSA